MDSAFIFRFANLLSLNQVLFVTHIGVKEVCTRSINGLVSPMRVKDYPSPDSMLIFLIKKSSFFEPTNKLIVRLKSFIFFRSVLIYRDAPSDLARYIFAKHKENFMSVATTHRVEANTSDALNTQFDKQLKANIQKYANATTAELDQRLVELDREWNIERIIEMQAPTAIALGAILGATGNRKWYGYAAVAASMVILHNLQGWYPLLPLFRRLGIRSQHEIEQERSALRALRGDHKAFQTHTHH
jgi:hypothetical protein